jgi:5-methylcytosine-specific restriction protein A
MSIRDSIQYVLTNYPKAMVGALKDSPVAAYLRHDFPAAVRQITDPLGEFLVEGSPGQGQWARSPWVAIFDPLITDTAQKGYYPVYLFREDFSGLYLSLNQGVTEVRSQYRASAKEVLTVSALDFRARLGELPKRFSASAIDLRPSSPENNSAYYERGNICAVYYDRGNLPSEDLFVNDLATVLETYSAISDAAPDLRSPAIEGDEPSTGDEFDEDHTRFKAHRRIERNPTVSKRVKAAQGFVCRACGFDFRVAYPGVVENEFIEAHHLVPISQLKGQKVRRDPIKDFAVLCSNCHRMIHRASEPSDLEAFKKALRT